MGYVLSEQQLYSSETDMMTLYRLLKSSGSNIVLCGHSMGAVQALRMALYLFEHDIDFFNTISVIVTGPYRWLRPHSMFTHLPNVHVYFSGYKDEIDAFASQNTLEHYVPYTVVTLEHTYMSELQPSVFIKRDYAEPFHQLQFYRQLMGVRTGGKRTKKRRKSKPTKRIHYTKN
jgi:pimeloyl-ACP methyl ester carboxylesterase